MWLNSPQTSAVEDSVSVSPDIQTDRTPPPTNLTKPGQVNETHRQSSSEARGQHVLTKLHAPVPEIVHPDNIVAERLL